MNDIVAYLPDSYVRAIAGALVEPNRSRQRLQSTQRPGIVHGG